MLVPYTKTKGHIIVYCQESAAEFCSIYDLMDDANEKLIKLQRKNEKLKGCLETIDNVMCLGNAKRLARETLSKVDGTGNSIIRGVSHE